MLSTNNKAENISAHTDALLSESTLHDTAWQVLDNENQWRLFSQDVTKDSNTPLVESQFLLDGLHCAACSGIIEHGLLSEQGVQEARVSLSKNRGVVVWSPNQTKPSRILQKIHDLGYQANPASHLSDHNKVKQAKRAAFWRWMVAGFCAMQVMMYAVPGYFSAPGSISAEMIQLLRWASWLLSLPVLLFSSLPFFKNALQDLKHIRVSMDLPIALGILITFSLSSLVTFSPNGFWGDTVYFDSMTMLVFFLLTARLIEARLHSKTMGALELLLNRIPENTTLVGEDGTLSRVLNQHLTLGDTVQVAVGEAFPADGVITQGDTQADEALLTGESTPINKPYNAKVIAGSYNLSQTVQMRVEKIGESTQYGQIIQLIEQAAIEKPRLSKIADRVAKPFLTFVLLSAATACLLLWGKDPAQALVTAATVLIVTCPCALSLATPAAMLSSASAMIKRGGLIKNLQAIEDLANIDTVIFDKTGTLTAHDIAVTHIETNSTLSHTQALTLAATLAQESTHPIAKAVVNHFDKLHPDTSLLSAKAKQEKIGAGITGEINDAANKTQYSGMFRLGSASFCDIQKNEMQQAVYLVNEQGWLATFALQEQLKSDAKSTVNWLLSEEYDCILLSGDQSDAVENIAKQLKIQQFESACKPEQKLAFLTQAKNKNKQVLMVGDGLNDGPILASAHVSIAMGKGVALSQAHADIILTHDDIGVIPTLIQHAKKTMRIIKQNITWAILYNAVCIPLAFMGLLTPWQAGLGMATSSIVVILNAVRLTSMQTQINKEEAE